MNTYEIIIDHNGRTKKETIAGVDRVAFEGSFVSFYSVKILTMSDTRHTLLKSIQEKLIVKIDLVKE